MMTVNFNLTLINQTRNRALTYVGGIAKRYCDFGFKAEERRRFDLALVGLSLAAFT
jgi:hypothetical protein